MDIWQCSGCHTLMIGASCATKEWWFNGCCFQHNCKELVENLKRTGIGADEPYRYASKKLTGPEILALIKQLQNENGELAKENSSLREALHNANEMLDRP